MRKLLLPLFAALLLISCSKPQADLLIYNARIYTVDSLFTVAEAMAIGDGKILATGKSDSLLELYDVTEKVDAGGKFIFPGFIDAHAHFVGYGSSLQNVDLTGTTSWQECMDRINEFVKKNNIAANEWIIGRGWDQNDWTVKEFPERSSLDSAYPSNPVLLTRVDGHAAIANDAALKLSGLTSAREVEGGSIEIMNGKLTGILIDNAIDIVTAAIPERSAQRFAESLLMAQQNCFAAGLTTIDDCGLSYRSVTFIDSLQKKNELKMRIYAMLSDAKENYTWAFEKGKIKTDRLNVRGFKVYGDGALGSRGACLKKPYSDKPGWSGFLLSSPQHFDSVAAILYDKGFQMCTHAIGDSGNVTILNTYAKYLKGKNDLRWRIEHAQVVDLNDINKFSTYNIIPSVQPTHATSDMYWAGARVGAEREKGAYAYKQLMEQNGWIPLGTDFPVEDISPIKTFYSAVFRKDAKGWPEGGYQIQNALSREQTIRGMTIWAARSNFEEHEKGSLEKGKFADFIIIDTDLMTAAEKDILATKVLKTYVGGEKVYERR